jgi:hypothetical protein
MTEPEIRDEHDAFQAIVNGLKIAGAGAQAMARFRPDQSRGWEIMAQTYRVCAESAYKLAEESMKRIIKS